MSRYVNIATRIWHDEKFRELPDDAKTLFMYLLSSPHSNMCGLFYLPPPYACHDLNWSAGRYADALNKLLCKGMVFAEGDIVLIKNFLRYNPIRGPKQAVGAASRLNEIPANSLIGKFVEILKENTSAKDYQQFIDTLSIPYRYPIDTPSIPDTDTDTDTDTESTCASDDARVCSDPQPGGSVEAEEETAAPTEPDINQQVQAVWDYYLERLREIDRKALAIQSLNHERRKLTKARRAKIRARLDEFGLEDCKAIIDNALSSPFMLGHNDSQRFYGEIETIFRNTEKAEHWLLNPPQKQIGGRNGGENRERAGGPNRRSGNGEVPKRGKYDHLIRDAGTGQFIGHPPGEDKGKTENHETGPGDREDGL